MIDNNPDFIDEVLRDTKLTAEFPVYIPTEEPERYVALCDKMTRQLLTSDAPVDEKARKVFRAGNEGVTSISKHG